MINITVKPLSHLIVTVLINIVYHWHWYHAGGGGGGESDEVDEIPVNKDIR